MYGRRYTSLIAGSLLFILLFALAVQHPQAHWRSFGGDDGGGDLKVWGYSILKVCRDGFIAVASSTTGTGQLDIYGYDEDNSIELTPRFQFFPANHQQFTPNYVERFTTTGEFNSHSFYAFAVLMFNTPYTTDTTTAIRFHSITPLDDTQTESFVPVENCQIADAAPSSYALLNVRGGINDTPLNFPVDVALDSVGNVYLTLDTDQKIRKYDSNGVFLHEYSLPAAAPAGIAINANNMIYVVTSATKVTRYDSDMNELGQFGSGGTGNFAFARYIAVDSANNVFVTDTNADQVEKFTETGGFLLAFGATGVGDAQLSEPRGIAVDASDNVYVVDSNKIKIYDNEGIFQSAWGTTGFGPGQFESAHDISIDAEGFLYVADLDHNKVMKFTPSGIFLHDWDVPSQQNSGRPGAYSVATGNHGRIYVVQRDSNDNFQSSNHLYIFRDASRPLVVDDAYQGTYNTPYVAIAPGFLGNDQPGVLTNVQGLNRTTLTAQKLSDPTNGTLELNADGSFIYTPNSGFAGTDTFTYNSTDGKSTSVTGTVTITIPDQPSPTPPLSSLVLSSPRGNITDSIGNPVYTWAAVQGANQYELYLAPADYLLDTRFYDTLQAAQVCQNNICGIDLTDLAATAWLANGSYILYMHADNAEENDWPGYTFMLSSPQPAAVTPGDTTNTSGTLRPTLNWALQENAVSSAFYQVYVAPTDDLISPAFLGWVSREDVCGSWAGVNCAFALPLDLQDKTHYTAFILSWGPGGTSSGGVQNTGWAGPIEFNMGGPLPNVPDGISAAVNGSQVTVTWNDDAHATAFSFWIGRLDDIPNAYYQKHDKGADGMTCDGATCTFTPNHSFVSGEHQIYMQAEGPGGTSRGGIALGWGGGATFTIP